MRVKSLISLITYGLAGIMLLTSCGKAEIDAPELIEPIVINESYRPVELGTVGDIIIRDGVVVPRDYCHFWTTSVQISEIKVSIGDYVEEGQVVALADTEGAAEIIASLNREKSLKASQWEIECEIYEYNRDELEYRLQGAKELEDTAGADAITTQLAVLDENHSYDEMYYQYEQGALDEQLWKQYEIEGKGTLVASHSGYVTYIKDFSDSDLVNAAENVVVISDYNDCYIELVDTDKEEKLEKSYPFFYTIREGKQCELVEVEYLPEELMTAQARSLSPRLRMKFKSNEKVPEVGANIPVFFQREAVDETLIVGNDSIYQDEQGNFVYVKNKEGRELRYIEIGASDSLYSEVLSGLSQGELVYYTSEALLPEKYEEYLVGYEDYIVTSTSDFYTIKENTRRKFYSEYEGQIDSVEVTQGQEVNAGDLICVVRTNEGSAVLTQMYNQIVDYKAGHTAAVNQINDSIAAKEAEIEEAYIKKEGENAQIVSGVKIFLSNMVSQTPSDATMSDSVTTETTTEDNEEVTTTEPATEDNEEVTTTEPATEDNQGGTTTEPATEDNQGGTTTEPAIEDDQKDTTEAGMENKVSPYLYEELCCQLEVLKLNMRLEELNYAYNLQNMESSYNRISCNNNGNGAVNIYAQTSGKIANLNIKAGKNIKSGDRLFNIEVPANSIVELRSENSLQINQKIQFQKDDRTYDGTVVGVNGNDGKFYFTDIDNKIYISTSSGQQGARYFVKLEDESFYGLKNDYLAVYPKTIINDSIVVPDGMVYREEKIKAGVGTVAYTYVWKLVDGQLVKQYVQCVGEPTGANKPICILSGIVAGDVLAKEITETEE